MSGRNARIQWLHNRIASGNYPNENLLAQRFEISRRQAERDVSYMKKELGAPIVYSPKHQGFEYSKAFDLPATLTTGNDDDYSGITAKFTSRGGSTESAVQLQIPYTAELYIPDKLAALELRNFVIASKPRKNLYVCEFHSKELFLGLIMSLDSEIKIISPTWLRDKAISSAEKILKNNK